MNKKTKALTTEQYKEIIQTMREGFSGCRPNERIATALVLEGNLGLRISDILTLRPRDIVRDGDRYRLEIIEQKTGKRRVFTVPLVIQQYIENYCLRHNIRRDDLIFPITERAVQKQLHIMCDYLGFEGISTHSFRKWYATEIYKENGYDIALTHSSPGIGRWWRRFGPERDRICGCSSGIIWMGNCLLSSLTGEALALPSGTPRTTAPIPIWDCRNIVLAESKDRVWNSIAEKDAAYLLLPYTEKSRQRVEQLLDERYQQYLEAEFADDPEERVARAAEGKPAVIPDWDGPLFCYASDRVAQDGCKVQIMDRLFPEREDMGWESGWAFYSGDEGDVCGEGDDYYKSHCGFYDIRDICRIDPDIIRFLNLPYGTMQMRGEDGAW